MKGRSFEGAYGGKNYKFMARLFGMGESFYNAGVGDIKLKTGFKALDLGCGPGALSFALAQNAEPESILYGIDISDDQLNYARRHCGNFKCSMEFLNMSMDELDFPSDYFDIVISSMAIHETPPQVRRQAIEQVARVLKPGGVFVLVDWSKPKFGLWGIVWFSAVCHGKANKDNWNNVYPSICARHGLTLKHDRYINSIARRQVFQKQ